MTDKPTPPRRRTTSRRLILTATAITVLIGSTAAGSAWIGRRSQDDTRQALSTVLETTQQAVHSWVNEHRATASVWSGTPEVARLTEDLLAVEPNAHDLLAAPAQAALRDYLAPVLLGVGYRGFFVISPEGVNLSSTRDENVGVASLLLPQAAFQEQVLGGGTAMSLPIPSDVPLRDRLGRLESGRPTMFAGAPVLAPDGTVRAILVFRIDPSTNFTAIFQRGRIGESGETYGFDADGRLMTESRFDAQLRDIGLVEEGRRGILNVEIRDPGVNLLEGETLTTPSSGHPLTHMASEAIAGRSGSNVLGYRDYRGVPVVGAWLWDDEIGMGMTTEIDADEASATQRRTRLIVFLLSGIGALLIALVSWDAARRYELEVRLENAMAKVLSGYVPICANCKNIKQDDGDWLPVEAHVSRKTDAVFSHGICPTCNVELYGDFLED
jgi:hypothetical protein